MITKQAFLGKLFSSFMKEPAKEVGSYIASKARNIKNWATTGGNWRPQGSIGTNVAEGVKMVTDYPKTTMVFGGLDLLSGQSIPGVIGGTFGGGVGFKVGGHLGAKVGKGIANILGAAPGSVSENLASGAGRVVGSLYGGSAGYTGGAKAFGGYTTEELEQRRQQRQYEKSLRKMMEQQSIGPR